MRAPLFLGKNLFFSQRFDRPTAGDALRDGGLAVVADVTLAGDVRDADTFIAAEEATAALAEWQTLDFTMDHP